MKRRRRSKPGDWAEDVKHNPDGSWSGKLYAALKPCKEPIIMCKFHKKGPWNNLTNHGLRYSEDEKGYYHTVGELVCTAD